MRRVLALVVVGAACVACGHAGPRGDVLQARRARYQADRDVVVAAIASVLAERYPGLELGDPAFAPPPYYISKYWWIEGKRPISTDDEVYRPPVGHFIRFHFALSEAAPYCVNVYAEVNRHEKGWHGTMTYSPGHAEPEMRRRPAWDQGLLDELDVAIDQRLRPYAVTESSKAADSSVPKSR